MIISEEEMREAIDRIARGPDGQLLYRYFQQSLCGVPTAANDSALREHNGRRSFAAELMSLMAKGIDESGGPDTKRTIVFTRKQPDASGKRVTAREYFAAQSDPEPGT